MLKYVNKKKYYWIKLEDWDWKYISKHPNITWEIIREDYDIYWNWEWDSVSVNKNITWEIINANPVQRWNWWRVSSNPNITLLKRKKSNGQL